VRRESRRREEDGEPEKRGRREDRKTGNSEGRGEGSPHRCLREERSDVTIPSGLASTILQHRNKILFTTERRGEA